MRRLLAWNGFKNSPFGSERWLDRLWGLGLLLAAILLFWMNLGALPLRDWDEGTVAQVAREIWRAPAGSQTWLYPTIAGLPYLNKPPLIHWFIALIYQVGGIHEWTTRLPGATLTALSVPLLYGVARELLPCRTPAIFAALIYLNLLPVVRHGRLAMLDGAVLFFFLLMLYCLLRTRRDLRWGLGIGIAFGLLAMTKGIIALLLAAIALLFIVLDTPRLLTSGYVWGGVLLGSVPVAAWYGAQWLHYGQQFVKVGLFDQSLNRVWMSVENNREKPWYYLLEILKYSLPWLLFVPQGLRLAWENRSLGWAKLVLVWTTVYLMAISLMQTKLPWYSMPVYPALALSAGMTLAGVWDPADLYGVSRRKQRYPMSWSIVLGLVAIAAWGASIYMGKFDPVPKPDLSLILAAIALTVTVAMVLMIYQDSQFILVLLWGCYVSLMLFVASSYWIWELGEAYPVKPVATILQRIPPGSQTVFTSYPDFRPSLNFYSDRQVLPATDAELKAHWQNSATPYLLVDRAALKRLNLGSPQVIGSTEEWLLITH